MNYKSIILTAMVSLATLAIVARTPKYFGRLFRVPPVVTGNAATAVAAGRSEIIKRQVSAIGQFRQTAIPRAQAAIAAANDRVKHVNVTAAFQLAQGASPNEVRLYKKIANENIAEDTRRAINLSLDPRRTTN